MALATIGMRSIAVTVIGIGITVILQVAPCVGNI
jgi:hypothetical protein